MIVSSTQAESGRQPLERQGATPRPNAPPPLDHTPRRNAAPRKAGLARRPPASSPPGAGGFSSASKERASRLLAGTSWSRAAARSPAAGLLLTLLGALCVLAPVLLLPVAAEAQTTVWSGTLTVRSSAGLLGCSNGFGGSHCSVHLSDDDFTHDSTDYAIHTLWVRTTGRLELVFDTDLTTATQALTLNLDGTAFAFEDADDKGDDFRRWDNSGLSWTVGATVSATLTAAGTTTDTTAPAFVSAAANGASLVITFDEDLAAAASLANSAFTVKKTASGGSEATVALSTTVAPVISGTAVTLTLGTALVSTDGSVKVTYTKPMTGSANKLVDAAGNETATFTDQTVTNNTPAANNPPVFDPTAVSRSVAENTAAGENVGAAVTATDADTGDTLTYTLGGADAAFFDIVSTSGQIQTTTGVTYDHEAKASYTVVVTASDGTDSADATVTISVTDVNEPPAAPAAPAVAGLSGSTTSLTVSWSAPPNTGKPAITSYDVQYRQGNSGGFTNGPQDATATSATITGLMASTSYQVQVRATNDEGDSAWSGSGSGTTGTTTTAPVAPAAPTVAAVSSSTRSLAVSWIAPADGGSAITGYNVQYRQGTSGDFTNWPLKVTDTSLTISGLTQNTLYEVQVQATNAVGDSDWSASGSGTTNADTTPPTLVSAYVIASGAEIHLQMSENLLLSNLPPASAFTVTVGGSDVTVTAVAKGGSGFVDDTAKITVSPVVLAGQAVVVAYADPTAGDDANAIQDVPGNDTADFTTGSGVVVAVLNLSTVTAAPSAPTAPTVAGVSGSTTSLTVSWSAPADNGSAITSYDLQYQQDGSTDWTNGPQDVNGTSATITGLAASTSYQVQVRATNAEGDSDWSPSGSGTTNAVQTATAPVAPAAPTVVAVTGSSTSLAVSWSAPADNGSAITSYDLQYRPGTSGNFADGPQNATGTSATLTGLAANSPYQVQVRATNAEGDSGWSASGSGTTNAATIDTDLVVIGFRGVSAPEGVVGQLSFPEDVGTAVLTAYLDRSPETALSVPWFTTDHTAVSPDDYTGGEGTLTFAPGETEQTIALPIVDDAIREDPDPVFGEDESFLVALEFGDDYRLKNAGVVRVLILDNDGDGTVTGDTRPPLLTQATVNGTTLVLTYNEALDGGSTPAPGDFGVRAAGTTINVQGVSITGSTVTLTLATAVEANQAVTLAYTPGANPIQDTTGADAATLPAQAATNNTGGVTDVTPPLLTGAAVSGSTLVLTYNETLDGASIPDPGDFSVTAAGSPITVTGVRVAGSTVSLTLATAVEANQAVTLAYMPGTNPIQDTVGNEAAPLSGQTVTHNTGSGGGGGGGGGGGDGTSQTVPDAPTNLVAEATDGAVTLRWDAPEEDGGTPITDYEYRINGAGDWISTGSTETTYTVTGLDNDTEYTFEVRAVNRIGRSQAPPEPAEVTPRAAVDLDFAHFANGAGTTSEVVLVNVAPYPLRPAIYFYDQEGEPIAVQSVVDLTPDLEILEDGALSVRTAMEPLGALTISTHGRGNLRSGSLTVVAIGPIGGVLRYSVPEIGVAGVGASPPLSDAIFPARRQAGGINTGVAIRNQGEAALVVQCRLMQDGAVLEAMDIPLKANGQDARFIEQVFPATDTSDFAGSVRCTAPGAGRFTAIAAEMDAAGGIFTTLPVVEVNRGRAEAATLDFAHFANGTWVTDLVFVNLETQRSGPPLTPFHTAIPPTRPAIYFYDTKGNPIAPELLVDITGDLEVTEDGALTVRTEMEPLGVLTISTHGRGEILSGSVRVVSEGPIGGMLRFDHPDLGVAGMGSSRPVNDAIFPVRRQDGGITTGVAIHNLESSPELVRCELRKAGALLDAASIPLGANGQTAWLIDQTFTGTDTPNFSGSVRCSSPGEGLFTVVALELDAGNRIFTTLPVVPVVEVP